MLLKGNLSYTRALVGYLCCKEVTNLRMKLPNKLIVSGCRAPYISKREATNNLKSEEFWNYEIINKGTKDLLIINTDNRSYYLECDKEISDIISLIDGKKSLVDIHQELTNKGYNLSLRELEVIIKRKLIKLTSKFYPETHIGEKYLYLKVILLNKKIVSFLGSKLCFLFKSPKYVFLIFLLNSFFLFYFINFYAEDIKITSYNFFVIALTMGISLILHELGHASASSAYGAKPGAIGFGFYLFTPALYADVTDTWRLGKTERIVVDIAGMFMESLLTSILIILFLIFGKEFFYYGALTIAFNTMININPLLRYDGYWILSDITGISNLRKKSRESLSKILKLKKIVRQDWFLAFYAILSYGMIFWFLYYIVFNYPSDLWKLPENFYYLILGLFNERSYDISISQIILPLIFYFIVFSWLKTFFTKQRRTNEKKTKI